MAPSDGIRSCPGSLGCHCTISLVDMTDLHSSYHDTIEEGGSSEHRGQKRGGRFNEDGDKYPAAGGDEEDSMYEDMQDLPRHMEQRRAAGRNRLLGVGQDKADKLDGGGQRKFNKPPLTEMSITQAMQNTMRRYTLEGRLFKQLLELKRQQVRKTKVNESILIKRMADANNRDGSLLGLKGYGGPLTFESYEKYLYDQLQFLQSHQMEKVPQFKPPLDDVEKLKRVLHRTEVADLKKGIGAANGGDGGGGGGGGGGSGGGGGGGGGRTAAGAEFAPLLGDTDEIPSDPRLCHHRTHRCHHAAHAYTGIPCAAYLAPKGKKYANEKKTNNTDGKLSLPRISGANPSSNPPTFRGRNPGRRPAAAPAKDAVGATEGAGEADTPSSMALQGYDPKKPLTVELQARGRKGRSSTALTVEKLESLRYSSTMLAAVLRGVAKQVTGLTLVDFDTLVL